MAPASWLMPMVWKHHAATEKTLAVKWLSWKVMQKVLGYLLSRRRGRIVLPKTPVEVTRAKVTRAKVTPAKATPAKATAKGKAKAVPAKGQERAAKGGSALRPRALQRELPKTNHLLTFDEARMEQFTDTFHPPSALGEWTLHIVGTMKQHKLSWWV